MARRSRAPNEALERLRVTLMDQAAGIGLARLARAIDATTDEDAVLQAAVMDVQRALMINDDQARLAVMAGIIVGAMVRGLRGLD